MGKKLWCIGPVSLCNQDMSDKLEIGGKEGSIDGNVCLKWLDSMAPKSVIYACYLCYLLLSKAAKGVEKTFNLLSLLDKILPIYKEVVAELKAAGASWIQFDEPTLVKDLEAHQLEAFTKAYAELESSLSGLDVLIETYFADVPADAFKTLTSLKGVTAFGFDLVRGEKTLDLIKSGFPLGKYLFVGVVDGRNIWANDLASSLKTLESLEAVVGKGNFFDLICSTGDVIYACFGSIGRTPSAQIIETGLGLEASNRPFIWIIRKKDVSNQVEKWLEDEKFEERIKGRGLIIRGWAPQVVILSHPSVGGFITHCGWNSTLEAICAGVPMITWPTWPMFAEQFYNEKLVVNVLKIGVRVGAEIAVKMELEDEDKVFVSSVQVKEAIEHLMDEEERILRAAELSQLAIKATNDGGSSFLNITALIQDITEQTNM